MSSFRFRLETLLRLRLADRDLRRQELAKAQRAEDTLLGQADTLAREQSDVQELSRKLASPGAADVDRLIASHRYELVLRSRSQQLANQIQQVRGEVERRRQVLVEADRQVRVLEKLRARQQAAHQTRAEKFEQKQLDEQAIIGFTRQEATR
jgi:flagellar FliJ protein